MDIAHLLSKQRGLADQLASLGSALPPQSALDRHMAEAAAILKKIEIEKSFWDVSMAGNLLRISNETNGIMQAFKAAMGPPRDTISQAIIDATKSFQVKDSFALSLERSREIMRGIEPFSALAQLPAAVGNEQAGEATQREKLLYPVGEDSLRPLSLSLRLRGKHAQGLPRSFLLERFFG